MNEAKHLLSAWVDTLIHRQIAVVHDAVKHPGKDYTISSHAGEHDVTPATARSDLFGLEELHLFKVVEEGKKWVFTPQARICQQAPGTLP